MRQEDEERATALLWDLGTAGIEVTPGKGERVVLLAYFAEALPDREVAAALAPLPGARLEAAPVPEVDWVARFREGFRPFRVGRFRIAPSWAPGEDGSDLLIVEPGAAFGTGTHETTRLCLAALEARAGEGPLGRVLDIGTGSGLLAVAAAKLGARLVIALDLDPLALEAARLHARLNRVELRLLRADGGSPFRAGAFDTVLANLTAALLHERRDEITRLRAPGGALVLSGMLDEDARALTRAYAGRGRVEQRREGEWAALVVGGER
ncbi:MAG TPA: 50S ribosomal protein L11 methyltransferase [Vicinamibacteria bacterium]|nr:50S ribosomal protein L11 methyltransferase [Vicinamibacteria bacterium]